MSRRTLCHNDSSSNIRGEVQRIHTENSAAACKRLLGDSQVQVGDYCRVSDRRTALAVFLALEREYKLQRSGLLLGVDISLLVCFSSRPPIRSSPRACSGKPPVVFDFSPHLQPRYPD